MGTVTNVRKYKVSVVTVPVPDHIERLNDFMDSAVGWSMGNSTINDF
jgi:hypothetical protein